MNLLNLISVKGFSYDNEEVTFTYIGIKEGLTYIQPFVQNNIIKKIISKHEELIDENEINEYTHKKKPELLIIACNKNIAYKLKNECLNGIIMPFRIHQYIKTDETWEEIQKSISKRERKRLKKQVQEYNLDYYTTQNTDDYFNFYKQMHVPTMNHRFGGLARSVEINKGYNEIFKKGLLFLVTQNNKPVSGSVSKIDEKNKTLNARLIGVLNGDDYYKKIGAQNHVYHSIIHWACNNTKIKYVNFQGCEPFLTKGTFQYKKRFGTNAMLPPNQLHDIRLLLHFDTSSKSVSNFLINNPLMIIDQKNNLGACYFKNETYNARLDIPYKCPGMNYHKIFNLNIGEME